MSTHEQIMNALLALLQTKCGATFNTYSRRFQTWSQMIEATSQVAQPALFLFDGAGFGGGKTKREQRGRGRPGIKTYFRTIVIYAQIPGAGTTAGPDATTPGGTVFAPLVESVENAFAPDLEGVLTLLTNGQPLVSHCWIEGDEFWATGDIDPGGQGMLTIPVQIMVP